jgi:PKD repeat protein
LNKGIIGLVILLLILSSLTLGCFDDSGDDDEKKPNKPPVADAGDDIDVLSQTLIYFSGSNSSDPDGEIVSFDWNFDDYNNPGPETSTDMDPEYKYDLPGEYSVTLTITDDKGSTSSDIVNVIVRNRPPIAYAGESEINTVFEVIYFNGIANDPDGFITEYAWDFNGDEVIDWHASSMGETTYFYSKAGDYQAVFIVTDNFNAETRIIKNVTIVDIPNQPPVADAGLNQTLPAGNVLLKGSGFDADGKIVLYEWDFDGDGTYDWSSEKTGILNHNFDAEGEYNAKLKVTDDSGSSATDIVVITIDNSYVKYYVSAIVHVNWNTTTDYLIETNSTINGSHLEVLVTDITIDDEEKIDHTKISTISNNEFSLTSSLKPMPGHTIQVQVLYYDTLIGARVIEVVNQSYELVGPKVDFSAVFDFEQELTENDRGETEIIRITSIGELELEHNDDLVHSTLHGTGEYYVYDESEEGDTEIIVESTDLWLNVTYSKGKIITQSISFIGHGTMDADYGDIGNMEIDIKKMVLVVENNVELVNYMYGEGTFSGSATDPTTGIEGSISGEVFITSELLGHDRKANSTGIEFDCSIYRTNLTMDGVTGPTVGGVGVKVKTIFINTTWNVDFEKYSNNTIYYEYTSFSQVANLDYFDSGSGYPGNHPTIREHVTHISDALTFNDPRPKIMMGKDTVVLRSEHDVILKLTVTGEINAIIDSKSYNCVDMIGVIISGGSGSASIRMIRLGPFAGVTVRTKQEFNWKAESLISEQNLKTINSS